MGQSEPNGVFAMVELNYQGVFNRNPFSCSGGVKTIFNDVDFSSMTYSEFVTFYECFMHEECKTFYYCEPGNSLMEGLNPILDDVEYAAFIFDAYGTDGVISIYVDHIGVSVDGWFNDEDNDDDEHESCINGENEDNIDELRNVVFEINEDVVHMNRTSNNPFLISKSSHYNYARNFKFGSLVTYAWIGSHYTKEIVQSHKISVSNLRVKVMAKFGIQVSMGQCRRAKKYALNLVEGSLIEHYGKLCSYGHDILRTNHGKTVKLDVEDGPYGKKYFSKFYCCFQGVKQGWIEGCKRIIGLDGCFLKGVCKGELLCAIGRDSNDNIYLISWVVVNVENKQNWKWFLELLIDDLNLNLGNGFSLMSDQHTITTTSRYQGLIEAVKELLPYVKHRQCARHICQNLQKRFTGAIYHTLFWRESKATIEHAFKVVMKEIETLNPDVHQYIMEKDPKTWSKAFFQAGRCCDAVENGFS
uniref:MULE transposase domain-containing protein n=1 Tax=Lactuca sativa TaxID=4236 RepID=A0A9R1W988_LACSA|nr:hypothetical protein LSAT_V11C300124680 [Lactuca sativa]